MFLYDIVTALYRDKLGGYQNMAEVYRLTISGLKLYSLADVVIAISGDI